MAVYTVQNQWGGNNAPWNPGGTWVLGARPGQNVITLNIKSGDGGQTMTGAMEYAGEGGIGVKATQFASNNYTVQNQWGGNSAPWNPGGDWIIGARCGQSVIELNATSTDGGKTLVGSMSYTGEGPIGFRATLQQ